MTDCHPLYHSTGVYDVNPSIDDFLGQADNYTTPTTNTNTSTTEQPPPPPSSPAATKRLACERCHNQKLRCARQQGKHSCDRCLAANAPCAERIPRRLGRPHSTNASVSKTAAAKKRRQRSDAAKSSGHHRNNSKATNSNNNSNVSVSSDQSQSNQVDDLKSMNCAAGGAVQQVQSVSVNRTPPSSIPDESRPTPWPLTGLLSPSDCSSPFDWNLGGNEADASADTAATLGEDAYQGHSVFDAPLMAGLGGLDSLITDLDEMPDTLLTTHMDMEHHLVAAAAATATAADANMTSHTTANTTTASSFSPPTTTISMTTSSSMAQVQQDPVERLTSLHRIYTSASTRSAPSSSSASPSPTALVPQWLLSGWNGSFNRQKSLSTFSGKVLDLVGQAARSTAGTTNNSTKTRQLAAIMVRAWAWPVLAHRPAVPRHPLASLLPACPLDALPLPLRPARHHLLLHRRELEFTTITRAVQHRLLQLPLLPLARQCSILSTAQRASWS